MVARRRIGFFAVIARSHANRHGWRRRNLRLLEDAGTMVKGGFVYILTNKNHTTLYTGVTNNLKNRVYQHREKLVEGFTKKFNLTGLVYHEMADTIVAAIEREKQIKNYSRLKKIELIQGMNPSWKDLYDGL